MNKIQLQEQLKQETKYSRWYLNIIEKAKSENRKKLKKSHKDYVYYENHHILPKSLFKEFSDLTEFSWNSVLLTSKEHFIVHQCIAKHYKSIGFTYGEMKMSKPLKLMSGNGEYNSKSYQYFKLNYSHSEESKEKMKGRESWNKGKKMPNETREKLRKSKENVSKETREKLSSSLKGRIPWNKGEKREASCLE